MELNLVLNVPNVIDLEVQLDSVTIDLYHVDDLRHVVDLDLDFVGMSLAQVAVDLQVQTEENLHPNGADPVPMSVDIGK